MIELCYILTCEEKVPAETQFRKMKWAGFERPNDPGSWTRLPWF